MVAADAIVTGKPMQEALWSVNTEKSYHETKTES